MSKRFSILPLGEARVGQMARHEDAITSYGCVGCGGLADGEMVADMLGRLWHAQCASDMLAAIRRCNEDRDDPPRGQIPILGKVKIADGVNERTAARRARRENWKKDLEENP